MTVEEFEAFLTQRGSTFEKKDIDHGVQIKVSTGETVNIYHTGKAVVGGKRTALRQELEAFKQTGFMPAPAEEEGHSLGHTVGLNKKVFVVYGHDTVAREKLELILLKMGMESVVLANLPAAGDTIIEKLVSRE